MMKALLQSLITWILAVLVLPGVCDAGVPTARTGAVQPNPKDDIVRGIVMVKFQGGVQPQQPILGKGRTIPAAELQALGARSIHRTFSTVVTLTGREVNTGVVDLSTWYTVAIDPAADPAARARQFASIVGVAFAEPKYVSYASDVPNDSLFARQQAGYFGMVHAPEAWTLAKGDTGVVIAVVDGGTYWQHPDISPSLHMNPADGSIGWNFATNSNDPRGLPIAPSLAEHGTETASVAAAATNNSIGIAGASWGCGLMPICASAPDRDNAIVFGFEGIQYAYSHGASIINCSWGRPGSYSQFEQDVITAATQAGALVVAAGANSNQDNDFDAFYPASYNGLLAVGATGSNSDVKASFSNYGVTVPVYAPGTGIWGATNSGVYTGFLAGTSFSSPLVAGLAGILKSVHRTWLPAQIAEQIRMTADSIDALNPAYSGSLGRGRVNFARALTESPSGIIVTGLNISTSAGQLVFLPGDTVVVRITIKNILQHAQSLTLLVSASDAAMTPLQGAFLLPDMSTNDSLVVPQAQFIVGQVSTFHQALVRISWVANGNERDQTGQAVHLFPSRPTWDLASHPVVNSLMSVRAVDSAIVWSAGGNGLATAPVVIRSNDGGTSWRDVTSNLPGVDLYCIAAVDTIHAWVGSGDGRIFATTDGGATWQYQAYPGQQSPFINGIWFFDALNGYAFGDPGMNSRYVVLATTNGGANWIQMPGEPASAVDEVGWVNAFYWTDPQHGWFGSNNSVVYRTTNGGGHWASSPSGSTNSIALAFRGSSNGIVGHDDGTISVTGDGGASWGPVQSPTTTSIFGAAFLPGSNDAWMSDMTTVYRSTDDGHTWSPQSVFPVIGQIDHIAFADTRNGWGVTSEGEVLRYRNVGPVIPPPQLPTTYALYQNYPNPFNNGTSIRYDLPVRSSVEVTLFDILGRRVRTIFRGVQGPGSPAPLHLDATGLASGVYIYRVTADPLIQNFSGFQSSRKMILLK